MKKWLPLKPGDIVDIVAPGFAPTVEELENGIRFLEGWGLVPRLPRNIRGKDILCSNCDEVRFQHLKEALYAKDSKAIWCVRGGYGSLRLIPHLLKLKSPKMRPKLFIGLSDITSLHAFLNQKWGWPTVHGPLLERLGRRAALPKFERELKKLVFGEITRIRFSNLKALNEAAVRDGVVRGKVSGGNLIVLQSSLGTKASWQTDGRILFFEDVGERGYRVDRVLEQFTQAGLFRRARAIVFGQFTESHERDGRDLVPLVIKRFAKTMKIPVFSGLQSGHDIIQRPVPFETPSLLQLGKRGELQCETGGSHS